MRIDLAHTITKEEARLALPVLKGGLKLLETKGWCQGASCSNNELERLHGRPFWLHGYSKDKFCATGAIREAAKSLYGVSGYHQHELIAARILEGTTGTIFPVYNDVKGRQKRQIIAKFQQAIKATASYLKELR